MTGTPTFAAIHVVAAARDPDRVEAAMCDRLTQAAGAYRRAMAEEG